MNWKNAVMLMMIVGLTACGSKKDYVKEEKSLGQELAKKNRNQLPLKEQIRQMPGVTFRYGVPVLIKNQKDINPGGSNIYEPLYVVNDYAVGNSFASIQEIVNTQDVKKIEIIDGAEASFWGSRGANGVIKITTY